LLIKKNLILTGQVFLLRQRFQVLMLIVQKLFNSYSALFHIFFSTSPALPEHLPGNYFTVNLL